MSAFPDRVRSVLTPLRKVEGACLAALMLSMAFLYVLNVAVREIAPSFAWIEEATLFALAWSVMLGFGLMLDRGRHVAMTAFRNRLSPALRRPIGLLIDATGLAFTVYVVKLGIDLTLFVRSSGQVSPTLGTSMAWLYGALPVGFALLALPYAVDLLSGGRRFDQVNTQGGG